MYDEALYGAAAAALQDAPNSFPPASLAKLLVALADAPGGPTTFASQLEAAMAHVAQESPRAASPVFAERVLPPVKALAANAEAPKSVRTGAAAAARVLHHARQALATVPRAARSASRQPAVRAAPRQRPSGVPTTAGSAQLDQEGSQRTSKSLGVEVGYATSVSDDSQS